MIGVLGATGQTGTPLLQALERAGAPVRALAHTPESAERIVYDAAEIIIGDVRDPAVVGKFVDGISTLFLLTAAAPDQVEVQNNIVDAAAAVGVAAIVKYSVCTSAADSLDNFSRWHYANDVHIERSGVPYTILHPHTYMQTIALQFADTVRANGTMAGIPGPADTIAMVDARDCAEVAAAVLLGGDHRGEKILITGPEALSYADCAERIAAALGKPVSYDQISADEARARFEAAGLPDWLVDGLIALQTKYATEGLNELSDTVQRLTGKPARTFAGFLHDYPALFA